MTEERDIMPVYQKRFDGCHVSPRAYWSILKIFRIIRDSGYFILALWKQVT